MRKKHLQEEPLIKKKVPVQPIAPELPVQLKRTTTSISPRRNKAKKQLEKRILDSLSNVQRVIPDFVYCDLNEDSRKWQFKDLVFKLNLGDPYDKETKERMGQYFHDYNQKRKYGPSQEQLVFQFDSDNDDVECQEDKTKFDDEPLEFQEDWRNLKIIEQVSPLGVIQDEPKKISFRIYQRGKIKIKEEPYKKKEVQQENSDQEISEKEQEQEKVKEQEQYQEQDQEQNHEQEKEEQEEEQEQDFQIKIEL